MGSTGGDIETAGLTPEQRFYILGQCTDLNLLHWTFALASPTSIEHHTPHPREHPGRPCENTYTFSQVATTPQPRGGTRTPHQ